MTKKELLSIIKVDYYRTVGRWDGLFPALIHILLNPISAEAFLFYFRIAQLGGGYK